ncbi:MAG: hypothetical protein DHS20C01_00970 [marine bacterium B5-7]|nr:MAG: hypothetical protein DHS20C01_00970 [marine bacterium B5-7]
MTHAGWIKCTVASAALALVTGTASADDFTWFGESADGKWLTGLKLESIDNSRTGYRDASNLGLLFGYEFSRPIGLDGTSSFEFEYSGSIDDGTISDSSFFGVGGEWDVENIGLYFTYRTPGNVYFKGKLGVLHSDIETRLNNGVSGVEKDTSFSFGAGLGLKLGIDDNFRLEAELVGSSGDNDINTISIGGLYRY